MRNLPLLDIGAAIIVVIILALPAPTLSAVDINNDVGDSVLARLDSAQAKIAAQPAVGAGYYELSVALMNRNQFDWALDVAMRGYRATPKDNNWLPAFAAALAHIERAEIKKAHEFSLRAHNTCAGNPACPAVDKTRIRLIHSTLVQVVDSDLPPKEAYERAKRPLIKLRSGS